MSAALIQVPTMPAAVDRRFWRILIVSIAFHALLLAGMKAPWQDLAPAPVRLIATLRASVSASLDTKVSHESGPPAEVHSAPAVAPKKVRQLSRPAVIPSPRRVSEAARPANPVPAATVARADSTPVNETAIVAPTAPSAAPAAAAPVVPVVNQAALLAGYRQRLSGLLAGQQTYPRIALLRGWEGEVRLRLRVARKGNLIGVSLDHSSGHEVLDQHAMAMLEHLGILPPLPDGLEGSEIQVVVPVNYKLTKSS